MLTLTNIHKSYEGKPLLKGISLEVAQGETICLLGPSGSGKSTLLRIVAGLEEAEAGDVLWQGKKLAGVAPHERKFGLIFQDYALFPHLNVFQNVAFGLKMQQKRFPDFARQFYRRSNLTDDETASSQKHAPRGFIEERVTESLRQVHLTGFESRRVTDLSGGEQQRVALARALAPRPRLLMFDEPLGALDRRLREYLIVEIREILRSSGVPAIYVTHDQAEAFALAQRVMLLNDAEIVQSGSPEDIVAQPASAWVAEFLGVGNEEPRSAFYKK